jgi:hypothetical protein
VAITEFKRPGAIQIEDWEEGFGPGGRLGPKAEQDSRQLNKYLFKTHLTPIQYTDMVYACSICLQDNPSTLLLTPVRRGNQSKQQWATAKVHITKISEGENLLATTLSFVMAAYVRPVMCETVFPDGWPTDFDDRRRNNDHNGQTNPHIDKESLRRDRLRLSSRPIAQHISRATWQL